MALRSWFSVRAIAWLPVVAFFLQASWSAPADAAFPKLADYAGGEAGLVVIVDPASAESATQLARQSRYLVALLDEDPESVGALNQALADAKVYPTAQAHRWWTTDRLPFRTNSVNVVILPEGRGDALLKEAERVIAPGYGFVLVEKNGSWQEHRKPRPEGMSTWYGFARDGGNSFYSPDTELQLVNSVQFFGSGNRLRDKNLPFAVDERVLVHDVNKIEGRDAFSGLMRWHSDYTYVNSANGILTDDHFWWLDAGKDGTGLLRGFDKLSGAEMEPIELGPFVKFRGQDNDSMTRRYRVVSDGKVIYATGGYKQLTAHDATTGKQLWKKDFEHFAECPAVSDGLLTVLLSSTNDSPRETAFSWNNNIGEAVVGLDPATGKELWRNTECKGRPIHNLAMDDEKVVVCSFLFNGGKAGGDKKEDAAWYEPLQFLQVIERDSGKTRFFRTDFTELTSSNSIQLIALSPGKVGIVKDNDLAQFDAKDGKVLEQYRGPGYHLAYPAVTPNHFYAGNAAVPLNDKSVLEMGGHDLVTPSYGHRNAPANGMLYTPSHLSTVSPEKTLGSALALIQRDEADYQRLALDDDRRMLVRGKADWSEPGVGDWPTLRGDFERSGWLNGKAPVPTQLAWEQQPTNQIDAKAANILEDGWEQDGFIPGPVSQPTVDGNNLLVVQATEHRLICFDSESGKEQWSRRFNGRIRTAPTLAGGIGYVGCDDGTVSAIDLKDGRVVWQFFLAPGVDMVLDHDQLTSLYPVPSAPVLLDGSLYVAAGRHTNLELGIVVWKLDPASGQPLGHVVLDAEWMGPDPRLPQPPSTNGKTNGPEGRARIQTNDVLQVRDKMLVIGSIAIDPQTMAAASFKDQSTVQHIEPARGGIHGGVRWIRPADQNQPNRLSGVEVRASNPYTSDGMILNRELGLFAMTYRKTDLVLLQLGFDNNDGRSLLNDNANELPMEKMDPPAAMAGRGDLIYLVSKDYEGELRLLVINRNDPGKAVADVAVERLDKEEAIIPDGIAITDDMVYLVTTAGRILAFK